MASVRQIVALVAAVVVITIAAFALGRVTAPSNSTPTEASAAAGFARDMQVHHDQGVELALIIRDLSDDPEIRGLAYDIARTQAKQSGQMYGWLAAWNLTQAGTEPAMTWMSRPPLTGADSHHDGTGHTPGDPMPGLATREQIETLSGLTGVEAEKYFLELMIAHHKGAIEMAEAALVRTEERVVVDLATGILNSQGNEIDYMNDLLAAR